jgi:hypothetical protein
VGSISAINVRGEEKALNETELEDEEEIFK